MAVAVVVFVVLFALTYKVDQTNAQVSPKGDFIFGNYKKMEAGKIFEKNGTSLSNFTTEHEDKCLIECTKQEKCLAINLFFDKPNQVQCQLLNWGGTAFHRYLKPRPNSYSMQKLVPVSSCRLLGGMHYLVAKIFFGDIRELGNTDILYR